MHNKLLSSYILQAYFLLFSTINMLWFIGQSKLASMPSGGGAAPAAAAAPAGGAAPAKGKLECILVFNQT